MTTFAVSVPVTFAVFHSRVMGIHIVQLPSNVAVLSTAAISILVPVAVLGVSARALGLTLLRLLPGCCL